MARKVNQQRRQHQPDVTAPTVDNITGNSGSGEITGTADPNTTIEVRDPAGAVIGTGTSDANGDFTVTLPTGTTNPGDTLTVIGKDNAGNESQPTEVLFLLMPRLQHQL